MSDSSGPSGPNSPSAPSPADATASAAVAPSAVPAAPGSAATPAGNPAAQPPTQPAPTEHPRDSWKETFESIAVALILAFVFRAFIVEAFVIPTGSMASTLMGRHYEIRCDHCGYGPWSLTIPKEDEEGGGRARYADRQPDPVCPNCQHVLRDWRSTPLIPMFRVDTDQQGQRTVSPEDGYAVGYAKLQVPVQEWDAVLETGEGGALRLRGVGDLFTGPGGDPKLAAAFRDRYREAKLPNYVGKTVHVWGKAVNGAVWPEAFRVPGADPHNGDRILVLKYLYEFSPPARWDVIVFRFPGNPKENYIKRLVGRPGESVMLVDGDVYISTDRGKTWNIARKPIDSPAAQEALWHLVHTADFPNPAGADGRPDYDSERVRLVKRWEPLDAGDAAAWAGLESPVFSFDGADGRRHAARYAQYLPSHSALGPAAGGAPAQPTPVPVPVAESREPVPIYDFHPYNGDASTNSVGPLGSLRIVGDLRLSADVVWKTGTGYAEMTVTRLDHQYTARLWADGRVFLFDRTVGADGRTVAIPDDEEPPVFKNRFPAPTPGVPVKLELSNADGVVSVKVGGKLALRAEFEPDLDRLLKDPNLPRDPRMWPKAELAGKAAAFDLRHVRIDRDVFYKTDTNDGGPTARAGPGGAIHLSAVSDAKQSREYFVLGDNSTASLDSRYWPDPNARSEKNPAGRYQLGTVPEENLTGKAFFVYWPSGHYLWGNRMPFIPRAEKMRLIQ
jgi:signal peptidase I